MHGPVFWTGCPPPDATFHMLLLVLDWTESKGHRSGSNRRQRDHNPPCYPYTTVTMDRPSPTLSGTCTLGRGAAAAASCAGKDSNLRTPKGAGLQPAAVAAWTTDAFAGPGGFEPPSAASETAVLPLHHGPMWGGLQCCPRGAPPTMVTRRWEQHPGYPAILDRPGLEPGSPACKAGALPITLTRPCCHSFPQRRYKTTLVEMNDQ